MNLNSILGALGADAGSEPAANQAGNDPTLDSLGSLLGGGAPQGAGAPQASGGVGDLLNSLLGGGASQGAGGGGDLLSTLLGGGASQGSGSAGDLLSTLLGGGASQGASAPQASGGVGSLTGAQAGASGALSGNAILGPNYDSTNHQGDGFNSIALMIFPRTVLIECDPASFQSARAASARWPRPD